MKFIVLAYADRHNTATKWLKTERHPYIRLEELAPDALEAALKPEDKERCLKVNGTRWPLPMDLRKTTLIDYLDLRISVSRIDGRTKLAKSLPWLSAWDIIEFARRIRL